ncbi:hypothetical protein PFICI_09347 [Pestalotiopsis fici W106-1]|uniref:Uncharacterized protein n=1 Tax=Pestalotiopsis fici (strain W106-1 / CGMCC3.15140) TaxID=1229662 RepID=W3X0D9_PESFW|nr:uncharacterized protein PFICI_09347 [Pestalotiopsis fici W106-1]ETS79494.1 hypothetical protein PFICI_09347 [Pestalotiopsis fici W106-1]
MAALDLRVVAAASFIPAFPLLLAEGIVSHHAVPAVGLVPLAFSSGTSLFIFLRMRVHHKRRRHSHGSHSSSSSSESEDEEAACDTEHPIIYFVIDLILAAALLVVLVFSWTKSDELSGKVAALAAYATIPLLINFLIHVYFSVRSLSAGLALYDLTQYFALQIVPAECPHCEHRIRPTSLPRIPWFHQARRIKLIPGTKGVKVPEFEGSGWFSKKREWQAPKWLRKRQDSDDHGGMFARHDDDDEHERYRDEPEHAGPADRVVEPEEVQIAGKIKKKVREGLFHHGEEATAESGPSTVVAQEPEEVDAGDKFKQKVENFLHHGDEPVEAATPVVVPKTEEVETEETIKQKVGHLLHHEEEPVESAPTPAPVVPEVEDDETHETIKQKVDHLLHHEEEPAESAPAVATPKPEEPEAEAPETMKQKMDHLLHHDDDSDSSKSSSK